VRSVANPSPPGTAKLVKVTEYDTIGALVWQQQQPMGVRTLEDGIVVDGLDTAKLYVEPQGQLVPAP
jgi:hypothetical protein